MPAVAQREIRVGIVGANANGSWANVSHVPAINGLPGLKLAAVATRNEQSARKAALVFGADRWFPIQHGLHNARLIEAVRRAAARGERQKVC